MTQELPTFVTHLECSMTGQRYEPDRPYNLSEDGWPMLVRYDLDGVKAALDKETIARRTNGLWKWRELLPVRKTENVVALGAVARGGLVPFPLVHIIEAAIVLIFLAGSLVLEGRRRAAIREPG